MRSIQGNLVKVDYDGLGVTLVICPWTNGTGPRPCAALYAPQFYLHLSLALHCDKGKVEDLHYAACGFGAYLHSCDPGACEGPEPTTPLLRVSVTSRLPQFTISRFHLAPIYQTPQMGRKNTWVGWILSSQAQRFVPRHPNTTEPFLYVKQDH